MDFNQIDLTPMKSGYGVIFQGGLIDPAITRLPTPLAIIRMNADGSKDEEAWLGQPGICLCLCADIQDVPGGVMPDNEFLSLVNACIAILAGGINLYIHCVAGVSRSAYCNIAIHMRVLDLSYDDALALVKSRRPITQPNAGFVAHLRRLEQVLRQP